MADFLPGCLARIAGATTWPVRSVGECGGRAVWAVIAGHQSEEGGSRREKKQAGVKTGMLPVLLAITVLLATSPAWPDEGIERLGVGQFSKGLPSERLPRGWEELHFKKVERHTIYQLVQDGGLMVVKAASDAAASGLMRKMRIDLREYPLIEWQWKVRNVLRGGDVTSREGDDYPARVYITFAYDPARLGVLERAKYGAARLLYGEYPPAAAINYIWESKAPVGTVVPNPYSDRVKMIVVESGPERLGAWISERRNVYLDYQQVFGGEVPPVAGVAIMTDTDNTGETAVAYYGDIVFLRGETDRKGQLPAGVE